MNETLSDDIQNGILFLILTDLKFLIICRNKINPDIFKSSIQKQICKISFDFYDKYGVTIGEKADEIILTNFPENEQTIIIAYLNKLFSEVYIKEYIFDKLDLFLRKRLWEKTLIESVELLDNNDIDGIEERVKKLLLDKMGYSNTVNLLEEDLKGFYNDEYNGEICCPTGIKALDLIIGGLKRKELSVIVAPLNVGKSFFFIFLGSKALLYSKDILYITTEMSEHQVKSRFFQRFSGVTNKPMEELEIWSGKEKIRFKPDHLGNVNKVKKSLKAMRSFGGSLFLKEFPDKTLSIRKLENLISDLELAHGKSPDIILVDGLQGLKYNENKRGDDWKALEELSHELRRIAMEKNIAVVTSTHSQRAAIGNKIIQSKDIRGSIDILNVCDLAISINQTNEELLLNQARLFVMRSRSSKKWAQIRIYTNFDMGNFCTFSELMDN